MYIPDVLTCRLIPFFNSMNISRAGLQWPLSAHAQTLTVNWLILYSTSNFHQVGYIMKTEHFVRYVCLSLSLYIYHHLQKFKTNFQNPTTQWKKQSWKYFLFKNIYFQQITILYYTLPPLWYEMVTVSSTVSDVFKIIEIPTNSQVVLHFCKWW